MSRKIDPKEFGSDFEYRKALKAERKQCRTNRFNRESKRSLQFEV